MTDSREMEIVGGGLAGLSLGVALRRAGVPTTIHEAGTYPRHRVCGEFIAGLSPETIERLGLEKILGDARHHHRVRWFRGRRVVRDQALDRPALGLSRHRLDARLADEFIRLGGQLQAGHRIDFSNTGPGRVWSTGRQRTASPWLGLKAHALGLVLASDLEFHLGRDAYIGLAPVEDGRVNICGLFRRQDGLAVNRSSALLEYIRASGLPDLAARISGCDLDEASFSAVAGFRFGRLPRQSDNAEERLVLGDAFGMIPPYTGHGMAMAFQSAETALPHLLKYSRHGAPWGTTVEAVDHALQARFRRKLGLAARLHPFLVSSLPQRVFDWVNRTRLLPLRSLTGVLHA